MWRNQIPVPVRTQSDLVLWKSHLPLMKETGQVPERPGSFPSRLQPEARGKSASGLENGTLQKFFWRGKANRGIKRNNAVKIPVKCNCCPLDSSEVCLSLEIFNQRQFVISINSSQIFINSRFQLQLPCPVFPLFLVHGLPVFTQNIAPVNEQKMGGWWKEGAVARPGISPCL